MNDAAEACQTALEEHGYAILPRIVPQEMVTRLRAAITELRASAKAPMPPTRFSGFKTIRYFALLNEQPLWQEVVTFAPLLKQIEKLLGKDCLLSLLATTLIEPGEVAQEIHCDDDLYHLPRPHPELVINSIWALDDFTDENGATRVVPGSHLWPEPPVTDGKYETVPVTMPAGSIALISGRCYHGAGANTTSSRREAVIVNFCAGAMRQHENQMLTVKRSRAATFSRRLQQLIGYQTTFGGAGFVDYKDPLGLLKRSDD